MTIKMKLRHSSMLFFLIMTPFVEPRMFNEFEFWTRFHIHEIYELARYLGFIGILLFNLRYLRVKYSLVTKLIILYFTLMLFSTFINDGAIKTVITYSFNACGVCIFADLFISKYGIYEYCRNMATFLLTLVLINCITIFLVPNGLYSQMLLDLYRPQNWFLGYKNSHIYVYLPCLFFVLINGTINIKRIKPSHVILILIIVISIVISDSTTSLILMLSLIVYLVINYKTNHRLIENPLVQYGVILLLNYGLIFINIIKAFQEYIVLFFNKYSTLESRVLIWNNALQYIYENPIWGNGIEAYEVSLSKIYGQAHNKLLDVTYVGGIVGLICFLAIVIYIIWQLNYSKKNIQIKICTIVFLCYNILFLSEAQRDNPLFFVTTVAISYFCKINKNSKITIIGNC